ALSTSNQRPWPGTLALTRYHFHADVDVATRHGDCFSKPFPSELRVFQNFPLLSDRAEARRRRPGGIARSRGRNQKSCVSGGTACGRNVSPRRRGWIWRRSVATSPRQKLSVWQSTTVP